jgi:hypothetical protein
MQHPPVQADLAAICIRDRIDEGAVAAGYTADRNAVLQLLAGPRRRARRPAGRFLS